MMNMSGEHYDDGDHAEHADESADISEAKAEIFQLMREVRRGHIINLARDKYTVAKEAKTGANVCCPSCDKTFVKRSYQQAFCSNKGAGNCKDLFWNTTVTERLERAKAFAS